MQVILGTSVGRISWAAERSLAKDHATTFYGGTVKTPSRVGEMMRLRPDLLHIADMNGWNEGDWQKIYDRWLAASAVHKVGFAAYPCATPEHRNFDEPDNGHIPAEWDYTQALLTRFRTDYRKAQPFVTGALPIPAGKVALSPVTILALDLNAWAIIFAVAVKRGLTIWDLLAHLGYVPQRLVGYLTLETGAGECGWFDAAAKKYGVTNVARPPDFRTADKVVPWCETHDLTAFLYYHAEHHLTSTGVPDAVLKALWGVK